jgi:hypothetical protein
MEASDMNTLARKTALLIADGLAHNGVCSTDTAQLIFCRLSDVLLQLSDEELILIMEGILLYGRAREGDERETTRVPELPDYTEQGV